LISGALVFGTPKTAEASILSMVTSLFSAQAATKDEAPSSNSQKMPLLEAPINSNVKAGELITVPMPIDSVLLSENTAKITSDASPSNIISTYKVKTGDTIGQIAEKFGVTTNTVLWANNLKRDSKISAGQTLVILPISGVQHKVASGDTIKSIATKYKGDVNEIIDYNNLDNAQDIKVGDMIVIPEGVMPASATLASKTTSAVKKVASAAIGVNLASADTVDIGYFSRPIAGGTRTQGIHGQNGVDLADSCGTPIYASADGDVTVAFNNDGYNGGYGNYVVISHNNGSQTLYAHMKDAIVTQGQHVNKGQAIGTIGNTGKVHGVTGCHVHFEIRNAGIPNPF
jgi:murein DD-endopeptidase MepM/ murein hydrolase activator NlpD